LTAISPYSALALFGTMRVLIFAVWLTAVSTTPVDEASCETMNDDGVCRSTVDDASALLQGRTAIERVSGTVTSFEMLLGHAAPTCTLNGGTQSEQGKMQYKETFRGGCGNGGQPGVQTVPVDASGIEKVYTPEMCACECGSVDWCDAFALNSVAYTNWRNGKSFSIGQCVLTSKCTRDAGTNGPGWTFYSMEGWVTDVGQGLCGQDYAGLEQIAKPDDTKRCKEAGTRLKWMIADSVKTCREACDANSNCKVFELQGCAQSGREMSDLGPDSTCDKVGCALLTDCDAWSAELSGPGRHRAYKKMRNTTIHFRWGIECSNCHYLLCRWAIECSRMRPSFDDHHLGRRGM